MVLYFVSEQLPLFVGETYHFYQLDFCILKQRHLFGVSEATGIFIDIFFSQHKRQNANYRSRNHRILNIDELFN